MNNLPRFVQTVGLFVNEKLATVNMVVDQCGLDIVQLHGEETPEYFQAVKRSIIKEIRVQDESSLDNMDSYSVSAFLLDAWSPDAHGGTGTSFNWEIAAQAAAL